MSVKSNRSIVRERAASMLARIYSGNASEQDVSQARQRTVECSEYQQEFLRTAHLLSDMEGLHNSAKIQAILNDLESADDQVNSTDRIINYWPKLGVAAGLIVAIVIGALVVMHPYLNGGTRADGKVLRYVTRVGEQKSIDLADGSQVSLNTGSELLVNLTESERAITLVRGEAFFAVVADPLRPFFVDVGTRRVSVLGTSFNIRKMPNQLSVAVVEGVVALHKSSESVDPGAPKFHLSDEKSLQIDNPAQYRVTAGWVVQLDVDDNFLVASLSKDPGGIYSWRQGLVRFAGVPFYQVVKELNRYSGKKILIEDSGLVDIEVYASVRVDRIDAALASLEKAYPIKLVHYIDRIGIVSSGKKIN